MNVVIVGIDPGSGDGPMRASLRAGARIACLCGLEPADYELRLDQVNLHPGPGRPTSADGGAARNLLPLLRGRRVVALGRRVASALRIPDQPWHSWSLVLPDEGPGFVATVTPHPSGLSRWWNDPSNVVVARTFWERTMTPCVQVEGTDGSGKTTLVTELGRLTGLTVVPTDDPPRTWAECLGRIGLRGCPGLICDRSSGLIGELVYGPILRGGTIVEESELWRVVRSILHAVTFVYCRPPGDLLRPTFRAGEDPDHVRAVTKSTKALLRGYDEVMIRIGREGGRVLWYDRTGYGINYLLEQIGLAHAEGDRETTYRPGGSREGRGILRGGQEGRVSSGRAPGGR